jgi:hypothetical protein
LTCRIPRTVDCAYSLSRVYMALLGFISTQHAVSRSPSMELETPRNECRCLRKSGLLIRLVCGTKRGYMAKALTGEIYVTCRLQYQLFSCRSSIPRSTNHQTTVRLRTPYPRNISNMFKRIFGEVKLPSIASTTHY